MMADPKYVGLPGIVYDQPDVYETSELPESEQEIYNPDTGESNPAFEVLHISGSEAYDKFKGKSVNTSDIDFSDRISHRHRTGYKSNLPLEWNIVCAGEDETLVQKYQRLRCEVDDLQRETQQLQGMIKHGEGNVSVAELHKSVEELHSTLHGLSLEETLGKDILSSIAEPEVILQKKLNNLLEKLKEKGEESSEKDGNGDKESPRHGTTYELFYAPEQVKFNKMARAAEIEKRIDLLESLVGNNPEKLCSLSTWTNHKSLLGAVEVLSSRLALLEPGHLDHIEGRLHSVHTRMNSISEKKSSIEEADKQSKINELYELMKKCEVLCISLPEIVDRLASVENLHQEANQFNRLIKELNAAQSELNSALQTNNSVLSTLQEKFVHNLTSIQSNMDALDQRIQTLKQK